MANSGSLTQARNDKKDEFYTQLADIEKEMNAYIEYDANVFRGKTVLLPADDPFESNFFKFFALHFNDYGLKKLIATSYDPSPIVNTQLELSLFGDGNELKDGASSKLSSAYKIELTDVSDFDEDGRINITDVQERLRHERTQIGHGKCSKMLSYLEGDTDPDGATRFSPGDFRSAEVSALRDESDVVITNPPFSLFRTFLEWIEPGKRLFSIIGNVNAITYKSVFPLIMQNELWMGESIHSGDREFKVPDTYPLKSAGWRIDDQGNKYIRVKGVRWFTNINHGRRHQPLSLMTMADNKMFSKHKEVKNHDYAHYDNYDAIEIPYTDAIPSDYNDAMGVPITFLDKYSPEQFKILGITKTWFGAATKRYGKQIQYSKSGKTKTVSKLNDGTAIKLDAVPENTTYYRVDNDNYIQTYPRILIMRRQD